MIQSSFPSFFYISPSTLHHRHLNLLHGVVVLCRWFASFFFLSLLRLQAACGFDQNIFYYMLWVVFTMFNIILLVCAQVFSYNMCVSKSKWKKNCVLLLFHKLQCYWIETSVGSCYIVPNRQWNLWIFFSLFSPSIVFFSIDLISIVARMWTANE